MDYINTLAMLVNSCVWALSIMLAVTYLAAGKVTKSRHVTSLGLVFSSLAICQVLYLIQLGGGVLFSQLVQMIAGLIPLITFSFCLYYTWTYHKDIEEKKRKT